MRLTNTDALLVALVHGHYIDKMQCGEIKRMVERYTIDAVPVVRCEQCTWWYAGECMFWAGDGMYTEYYDYCSRGKRKEK